ncbi:hypothetical protein ACWGPQ_21945 [Saccharomonospora azurea]
MATKTAPAVPEDGTETTTETVKQSFVERKKEQAKAAAKAKAVELGSKIKTEATAMLWRNRRQLVPIKAAGSVAATGSTAALLAEHTELVDGAVAFGAAGLVAGGGALALRKFASKIPTEMTTRVKAGIAAGCLWCAGIPFAGVDEPAIWLGLGAATVGLSARWWQRIRPGYPTGPAKTQEKASVETSAQPEAKPEIRLDSATLIQCWNEFVAAPGCSLPGAEIGPPTKFKNGRAFPVQLVRGKQNLTDARAALPKIATGLGTNEHKLLFEPADEEDSSQVELRIVDVSPIRESVFFEKPAYRDGYIELGPYADGIGVASYHLYSSDGLEGGYVVGGRGSGKSRVLETIAITAMEETPTVVVYFDGQNGASSPLLWKHALWRGGKSDGFRMVDALLKIMEVRSEYNVYKSTNGFTPTPEMPGILIIVDECHGIFDTLGTEFLKLAREGRKTGMGVLAASQITDLTPFGQGGDGLRSSLVAGNGIALRTMSNIQGNIFPGLKANLTELPKRPGTGYTVDNGSGNHRTAQFRGKWLVTSEDIDKLRTRGEEVPPVRTAEEWFAECSPKQQLDDISAKAGGPAFLMRHEIAARQDAHLAARFEGGPAQAPTETSTSELADQSAAPSVLTLPSLGGGTITTEDGVEVPERSLNVGEQQLMSLLADGRDWHTAELAKCLRVSEVTVRKRIKRLESRLVKVSKGVYRAKHL